MTNKGQVLWWDNMLSEKLKQLRESNGLVQRQVAALLEVDTAYISKIENNEKPVSRIHLEKLSKLFNVGSEELLTLWLADKIFDLIKNEEFAAEAFKIVEERILKGKKN